MTTIPQSAIDKLRRLQVEMKSSGDAFKLVIASMPHMDALLSAAERCNRLEAVLRRIRGWDHLDNAADGPYWKREIDEALKEQP